MGNKTLRIIAIIVIVFGLLFSCVSIGVIGFSVKTLGDKAKEIAQDPDFLMLGMERPSESEETRELFEPFWEVWNLLHTYYLEQPLDDEALLEGAIEGIIATLGDPHTRYSNPEEYKEELESMAGEYEGIGAYVDVSGDYVQITTPIPGSPAEEAGLRPQDLVVGLDGEDVTGISTSVVLSKMRGPEGSKVTLTIRRGDREPFDVEIVRQKIRIDDVSWEMLDDGIAYVQLTQFADKSTAQMKDALKKIRAEKPKGLILDLRNNGGGYLQTCVEIASLFLPKDSLVTIEEDGSGERIEYRTTFEIGAPDVPMVLLINEGTASASEILTGTLRYHDRATVIGTTSYGKGSVQVQPVLSNGGAASVTIAHWLTPDETLIHGIGIAPDIEVELTEEDREAENDPQLDAAVSFLNGTLAENDEMDDNMGVGL